MATAKYSPADAAVDQADPPAADQELATVDGSRGDAWHQPTETAQGAPERLQRLLTEEYIRYLHAERARLVAEGQLRRFQARRWSRLGAAVARWRPRPWRVDQLARTCLMLLIRRPQNPPPLDLRPIDRRLAELGAAPSTGPDSSSETSPAPISREEAVDEASCLHQQQQYETALELLGSLPEHLRLTKRACLIARDCHLATGDVQAALIDVRRALESGRDQPLERQARRLLGELRESDPRWLPDAGPWPPDYRPVGPGWILHVVTESLPFVERGGTIRARSSYLAQRAAGFAPVVVTTVGFPRAQGFAQFPATGTVDGIDHHWLDLGPDYQPGEVPADLRLADLAQQVRQLAERVRPALIAAGAGPDGLRTALAALAVARRLGVPFVYELPGAPSGQAGISPGTRSGPHHQRRLQQQARCLREADRIIAGTPGIRDELVAGGVPAGSVSVVPTVVDADRFTLRSPDSELARRYGIDGRPVLGHVSHLGDEAEGAHLLRALAALRRRGTDAAGLIVGDGPAREPLERLAGELGLAGHVGFTGRVVHDRVADYYAMIDLYVVPGAADPAGEPLGPLEAMAMERPVLAADLPALRELVVPGERGEVVPPADPVALAARAGELLGDAARRARLAAAGRAWVLAERTIAANARRYSQALPIAGGE